MLLEIAIADAYGAGFEFSNTEKIEQHNTASYYSAHELYGFSAKYTDDTQMSIAIAELMLSNENWTDTSIANQFVESFKRDPRKGYSKGFYELLSDVDGANDFLERINNGSDRNGAAMRSVPLGFIKDKQELIQKASAQAAITHNTDIAIASSCTVALLAHFGLHEKGSIADIKQYLDRESLSIWDYEWFDTVPVKAYETVSAALSCLLTCSNIKDLLVKTVSLGGDTDSVASIAVGLATCFEEYNKEIPIELIESLDESTFGVEFLNNLDQQLYTYFLNFKK